MKDKISASTGRSQRRGRTIAARAMVLLAAIVAMLTASTQAARAGPQHHNTDPLGTGCAASASTIATGSVGGINYEIRYSSAGGTNWVRVPQLYGTVYQKRSAELDEARRVEACVAVR